MSLMYAQMGMSVISAIGQHSAAKHQYTMDKIARDYREKMSSISAAMQSNTLTANEISTRDALVRAGTAIQVKSLKDRANATVSAAASGVSGGSVTNTMRGLMRSKYQAMHAHQKRREATQRSNTQNRRQLALAKAMNKDITPIQPPSAASALLGLGASLVDIWDSHQPPGSTLADRMAGVGR